jgi:hypothetical protein
MSPYSSSEEQKKTVYGRYSELAVSPFVSVKMNGLGIVLEQLTLLNSTGFGHLKSCWEGYTISHACTLRETSRTRNGGHTDYDTGSSVT